MDISAFFGLILRRWAKSGDISAGGGEGWLESGLSEIPLREIPSACGRRYLFLPTGVLQSIEWQPLPLRVIVFFRRRAA